MIRTFSFCASLLLVAFCSQNLHAQQLFNVTNLDSPETYGDKVAQKMKTVECYEYQIPESKVVVLKNGFRKDRFVNEKEWLNLKQNEIVTVSKVQVVFSKYPVRNKVYNEIYPLLFDRIKATIAMDSELNDSTIEWERVWQTHCENNDQVNQLFHGVVIHYKIRSPKLDPKDSPIQPQVKDPLTNTTFEEPKNQIVVNTAPQKSSRTMSPVLEYMLNHPTTPESLRQTAKELSTEEAETLVLTYYREEAKSLPEGPMTDPAVQLNYMYELEVFARQFPETDTVVGKVLDRHPEWKEKIVVNDWTGSMYGYGSQVILWHMMNLENSGISSITLFNDGDKKTTKQKKIGKTKGIYTAETRNPSEILELFNSVMSKGGGGDGPENDVEAILKAKEKAPNAEIILIADNSACVRDISLAHKIGRPVRVILCGYKPKEGVNPDYVYLAKVTGGGIYTLEEDLEQLNAEIGDNGTVLTFDESRFKLSSPQCFEDVFYAAKGREYSLKKARWNKKDVRVLEASAMELETVPNYVHKMPNLQSLNLSKNNITEISDAIGNNTKLSELDLSNNRLSTLPSDMQRNRFLEHLTLDQNEFSHLPEVVSELNFLRELRISENTLTSLSPIQSKVLSHIDVSKNQLTELPDFSQNNALLELNASSNQLTKFPEALPHTSLEVLDLSFNSISQLPNDLTPYIELKALNLQGNPIPTGERIRIRQALFNVDLTF